MKTATASYYGGDRSNQFKQLGGYHVAGMRFAYRFNRDRKLFANVAKCLRWFPCALQMATLLASNGTSNSKIALSFYVSPKQARGLSPMRTPRRAGQPTMVAWREHR